MKQSAEDRVFDQTNLLSKSRLLVTYMTLGVSLFITYCDQTGIGVALPVIARDLNASNTISWAGTSALIANTVFQVLYGRLSDILGRKVVYLSALGLLCLADLLCAVAPNADALYVFRGIAGIAQGGINSLTMMIVSDVVTLRQRGKYQGILGLFIGLGNTCGPLLFAAFAERATWRGMYYFLTPSAFLCLIASFFLIPSKAPHGDAWEKVKLIDWYGIVTGCVGIIFLLIPVSGGGSYFAWDSAMVIAMLTIAGISLILFVVCEGWVSPLPMTPRMYYRLLLCVVALFVLTTNSNSVNAAECTGSDIIAAMSILRSGILRSVVLHSALPAERKGVFATEVSRSDRTNARCASNRECTIGAIHFTNWPILRSHLERLRHLVAVSTSPQSSPSDPKSITTAEPV